MKFHSHYSTKLLSPQLPVTSMWLNTIINFWSSSWVSAPCNTIDHFHFHELSSFKFRNSILYFSYLTDCSFLIPPLLHKLFNFVESQSSGFVSLSSALTFTFLMICSEILLYILTICWWIPSFFFFFFYNFQICVFFFTSVLDSRFIYLTTYSTSLWPCLVVTSNQHS